MKLYEKWITTAYNQNGESNEVLWNKYIPVEQKIYEQILEQKIKKIEGTTLELAKRFNMPTEWICGFLDGIQEANANKINVAEIEEEDNIVIEIDFEKLFKAMVLYKAEHLIDLPQWNNIYTEEERKAMYKEQRSSTTYVREEKTGRNDPCKCGSGKKYKKCCGANG